MPPPAEEKLSGKASQAFREGNSPVRGNVGTADKRVAVLARETASAVEGYDFLHIPFYTALRKLTSDRSQTPPSF